MKLKLWADFNTTTKRGLRLNCIGTLSDLARQGVELKEGLELYVWCEDIDESDKADNLFVEAIAYYDNDDKCWEAVFEWADIKHESERKNAL